MRIVSGLSALVAALSLWPGGAARAACTVARLAELPVEMKGLSPLISAKINGQDSKLLVDSGAGFSFLSTAGAARHGLGVRGLSDIEFRGVTGRVQAGATTVKRFTLGGVDQSDVDFVVMPTSVAKQADGLIGLNVLRSSDVEYDLGGRMLRLFAPKDCANANLAYWAGNKPYSMIDLRRPEGLARFAYATVTVNGVSVQALLDTGASVSMVKRSAAARLGMRLDDPGVTPGGSTTGANGLKAATWIVPVKSFSIGDETVANTRLRVGDLKIEGADMVLGADFFLSHRIYVSNALDKLFFTYNGGRVFDLSASPGAESKPGA